MTSLRSRSIGGGGGGGGGGASGRSRPHSHVLGGHEAGRRMLAALGGFKLLVHSKLEEFVTEFGSKPVSSGR